MTASIPQGNIMIQNEASGRVLDVKDRQVVREASDKARSSQRWQVVDAGDGFLYIKHLDSSTDSGRDQVITATGPGGQPLTIGSPEGNASQWSRPGDGDRGVFINRQYSQALSVYFDDNQSVILWENQNGVNQRWQLVSTTPIGALDTSHGKAFCISARSGLADSVYLTTDYAGNDKEGNQAAQTWNYDPTTSSDHVKVYAETLQWHINSNDDGAYTIRTNPSWWFLKFELDKVDKDGVYARIIEKYDSKINSHLWHFTHAPGAMGNAYFISSAENPQFYLTREIEAATNNYVLMRRMWDGGPPNPIISTWYVTPVPSDIENKYPATKAPPA